MSEPLIAGLPPGMDIDNGYVIRLDAVDATTGATVAGVVISEASILAASLGAVTPEDLPPIYVSLPLASEHPGTN